MYVCQCIPQEKIKINESMRAPSINTFHKNKKYFHENFQRNKKKLYGREKMNMLVCLFVF